MNNKLLTYILMILTGTVLIAGSKFDNSSFDRLLNKYVKQEGVDYAGLVLEKPALTAFTNTMSKISPDSKPDLFPSENEKLAYWINAYNAFILKEIVDNYPVESIKDINLIGVTVWLNTNIIGGEKISFKSLEDDYIRERFSDPRIHFAINCASISCPPIKNHVYSADHLNDQLDQSTADFINNTANFSVDNEAKEIHLSAIFDWYASDFLSWLETRKKIKEPHILDFIKLYYQKTITDDMYAYKIVVNDYNWNLNDIKK